MQREDVIQLAEASGFFFHDAGYAPIMHTLPEKYSEKCFERFANTIEQRTLERAAQEADAWQTAIHDPRYECDCAAAIRALKSN